MASENVQDLIGQINSAARGEEVRDAIIKLLEMANSGTANAFSLNGLDWSKFAKQSDMDQIFPLATEPTENGTRPIGSGDLYTYLNDNIIDALNLILYGTNPSGIPSGETIESTIEEVAYARKKITNAIVNKGQTVTSQDTLESFANKIASIQTESNYEIDSARFTENGTYHPDEGDHAWRSVEVAVDPKLATKTIDNEGTFKASDEPNDIQGYSEVTVKLSIGSAGSESAALVSKSIDKSNLPEVGSASLSKTFHPSEDGTKAIGYSEVTVNLNGLVGEKPTIEIDASSFGEEQIFEAKDDDLYGYSKITVRVVEASGPFTVEFWNGSSKWSEVQVVKYDFAQPPNGNPAPPTDQRFTGWSPDPNCVTHDMKCYAQFEDAKSYPAGGEVQESWKEIAQSGGADIPRGAYKMLYFHSFRYNDTPFAGGGIPMIKVNDPEDSSYYNKTGSTSTWISGCTLGEMPGSSEYKMPMYFDSREFGYNFNGWENSDLRNFLNGEFLNGLTLLDDDVAIGQYIKSVPNTSYSFERLDDGSIYSAVVNKITNDKIWIPSYREISTHSGWSTDRETVGPHYTLPEVTSLPTGYSKSWSSQQTRSMSNMVISKGTDLSGYEDKFVRYDYVREDANFPGNRDRETGTLYDSTYLNAWNVAHPENPRANSRTVYSGGFLIGFCT